jgi:hypothetical protein
MKLSLAMGAAALCLASGAALANTSQCDSNPADQVVNCGFETGDFTGWTLGGSSAALLQTNLYGIDAYNPYSGSYDAFFGTQGATLGTHLSTDSITLTQMMDLEIGRAYTISFELDQDTPLSTGYTNYFNASINGTSLLTLSGVGVTGGYVQESFTYTATTSALSPLVFASQNDAGTWFLDDIVISQVPEPASMAMFGVGLLALAGLSRRRRA